MFSKLKKTWYADDFSYFIRNFGVFTLIFSTMTLIILQVMHSSLYTSVDDKLHGLSENPQAVIQLAVNRAKQEKYRTLALMYAALHPALTSIRFDVVAINLVAPSTASLRHLIGAFSWDEQ